MKKGFEGLYKDGDLWSGGFLKRVEMAKKDREAKEEMGYKYCREHLNSVVDTVVWNMKADRIAEECFNLMAKRVSEFYGDKTPVYREDIEFISIKMKELT